MKREDLSDALEHLDPKMIAEAVAVRQDRAEKEPEEIPVEENPEEYTYFQEETPEEQPPME